MAILTTDLEINRICRCLTWNLILLNI